jgi:phosphoribosyl-ATP pyrophosphohydrolase
MGSFHKTAIKKGEYGELSKIREELDEAYDAQDQGDKVMLLIELSDIIGAIEGVSKKYYGMNVEDLLKFSRTRSEVIIRELQSK